MVHDHSFDKSIPINKRVNSLGLCVFFFHFFPILAIYCLYIYNKIIPFDSPQKNKVFFFLNFFPILPIFYHIFATLSLVYTFE